MLLQTVLNLGISRVVTDAAQQTVAAKPAKPKRKEPARAFWLRQMVAWHWISAALSLLGLLLFAVTGITLNHASQIPAEPVVKAQTGQLPAPLLARLAAFPAETTDPAPDYIARWAKETFDVGVAGKVTETTPEEVYISLPEPGGDGWMTIDRATGEAVHERTTRGWIAWLNDLHKGRNTGPVWYWFIDIFAAACVVFALTGFALTWLHAWRRPLSWPMLGLGVAIPVLIALFFIH